MRAYFNDGLAWRAWEDPNDLNPGDVFFDHEPTENELRAAFPSYDAAKAAPPVFQLFKTDIIARMTDPELATFVSAMDAAPLRQRLMWSECQTVWSTDPYFPVLQAAMQAAFGASRAAEILAP
jgi:hypothetical protein